MAGVLTVVLFALYSLVTFLTFSIPPNNFQIPPSADFFFENATRLGDPDYKPNSQDVMRARPQEQAKSYKDREFRVWLPQGLKQVFIYDPVWLRFQLF